MAVSMCHVSLLSIMGHVSIKSPFRYHTFATYSKWKPTIFCLFAWVSPTPFFITSFIVSGNSHDDLTSFIIDIVILCIFFLLPYLITVVITLLSCWTYFHDKFRNQTNDRIEMFAASRSGKIRSSRHKDERKFVIMTILTVVGYSITCLPYLVLKIVLISNESDADQEIDSTWEGLIYALLFSKGLLSIVQCIYCYSLWQPETWREKTIEGNG